MILAALLMAVLPQTTSPGPRGEVGPPDPARAAVSAVGGALSTGAPALDPFTPESVLSVPNGPRLVKLPGAGAPLVAIRLSIPVTEGPTEAGAGRLLQILGTQRVRGRAAQLGLHFEGSRTPWGIAYTVAGARGDFGDMVQLLKDAIGSPDVGDSDFDTQRRLLHDEVLVTTETPAASLLAVLRARAAPGTPPTEGTPVTLFAMTRVTLRNVWSRTHRPSTMNVVVAGDVPNDVLIAAFRGLDAPTGAATTRPSAAAQQPDRRGTQVYRHWYAEVFRLADPRDPHGAVATLLTAKWLAAANEPFEAEVQLWELSSVQLLTVVSAAYPGSSVSMRQRMPRLLANTRQATTAEGVQSAVRQVRQEVVQLARTPIGLATVVGRHLDATGEPTSARRFLTALDRVTLESTRAFLAALERQAAQTPLREERRP